MSMRNYPCSGYLTPALSFETIIKNEYLGRYAEFMKACKSNDFDDHAIALEIIYDLCKDKNLPIPNVTVWFTSDDDIDDDLEYNTLYVYFDEEVLYEKTPKKELVEMSATLNDAPKQYRWAIYG